MCFLLILGVSGSEVDDERRYARMECITIRSAALQESSRLTPANVL